MDGRPTNIATADATGELTRLMLDCAADSAYRVDVRARICYVNQAACREMGYSREELLALTVHDISPTTTPKVWREVLKRVQARRRVAFETMHRRKDGSSFPVEVRASYLQHDGREYLFALTRDIHKRKQAEQRLAQLQNELEHAARLHTMGEMATGLAHEINQPLGVILNYASVCSKLLAQPTPQVARTAQLIDEITSAAQRSGDIVRRLRRFVGRNDVVRSKADLNELVREAVSLTEYDLHQAGIELQLDLHEPMDAVRLDRVQILQVILNLLRNAVEAMRGGADPRLIIVRTRSGGPAGVEVSVIDNGPGLDNNSIKRAFEPFFTTKPQGMGMGLPISRRIAQAHGGQLLCQSNEQRGATFRLNLPSRSASP